MAQAELFRWDTIPYITIIGATIGAIGGPMLFHEVIGPLILEQSGLGVLVEWRDTFVPVLAVTLGVGSIAGMLALERRIRH